MLTVKHIESCGHESICTATHVQFTPRGGEAGKLAELDAFGVGPASVSGDDRNTYGSGMVFVMNERGSTVGKYELG